MTEKADHQDSGLFPLGGVFPRVSGGKALRNKYVPVKEGGGITGEERLRDYVALLYGAITGYPGKPSNAQLDRKEALKKDIAAADKEVESCIQKELPALNQGLTAQQVSLKLLSREDWQKAQKK